MLAAIPSNSRAAADINFSGNWTLNESKSNVGEGRFRMSPKMTVKQEGNSLVVDRVRSDRDGQERTMTDEYTLDGKQTVDESENRTVKSTAAWSADGNSLVIKSETTMSRQGQTFEMSGTETWSLSADGKILTVKSASSSQMGDRTVTLVYDKN